MTEPRNTQDLYLRLGVPRTATTDEITKAYRGLAKTYHPDRNTDEHAATNFKAVNEAYETLRKPLSRRVYDSTRIVGGVSMSRGASRRSGSSIDDSIFDDFDEIFAKMERDMDRMRTQTRRTTSRRTTINVGPYSFSSNNSLETLLSTGGGLAGLYVGMVETVKAGYGFAEWLAASVGANESLADAVGYVGGTIATVPGIAAAIIAGGVGAVAALGIGKTINGVYRTIIPSKKKTRKS